MKPIREIYDEIKSVNKNCEIVAATKTRTIEEIRAVMDSGLVLAAGENRVQEFRDKYTPDFRWDFIGRLQTNKVKYLVGKATLIHSLDRIELAEAIEKESAKRDLVSDVLIEVNTGGEENKGGVLLTDVEPFLESVERFSHLKVRGLMAVTPLDYTDDQLKRTFDEVYDEFSKLARGDFDTLSMGMSHDYLLAAAAGATVVRPGRALFGERRILV